MDIHHTAPGKLQVEWFCLGNVCLHGWLARLGTRVVRWPWPRLQTSRWVRYRIKLNKLPSVPMDVHLEPIDERLIGELRSHPERDENQYRSALRFWDSGFGDPLIWREHGEPLCMQWLIRGVHIPRRRALKNWAGMYPPLPDDVGVTEGLYTFRRGLRRRGGAATPMAIAVFHEARRAGLKELRTHVHEGNVLAHRWAQRVGLSPCGTISRYGFDLRGLRRFYVYIHETTAPAEAEVAEAEGAARV